MSIAVPRTFLKQKRTEHSDEEAFCFCGHCRHDVRRRFCSGRRRPDCSDGAAPECPDNIWLPVLDLRHRWLLLGRMALQPTPSQATRDGRLSAEPGLCGGVLPRPGALREGLLLSSRQEAPSVFRRSLGFYTIPSSSRERAPSRSTRGVSPV